MEFKKSSDRYQQNTRLRFDPRFDSLQSHQQKFILQQFNIEENSWLEAFEAYLELSHFLANLESRIGKFCEHCLMKTPQTEWKQLIAYIFPLLPYWDRVEEPQQKILLATWPQLDPTKFLPWFKFVRDIPRESLPEFHNWLLHDPDLKENWQENWQKYQAAPDEYNSNPNSLKDWQNELRYFLTKINVLPLESLLRHNEIFKKLNFPQQDLILGKFTKLEKDWEQELAEYARVMQSIKVSELKLARLCHQAFSNAEPKNWPELAKILDQYIEKWPSLEVDIKDFLLRSTPKLSPDLYLSWLSFSVQVWQNTKSGEKFADLKDKIVAWRLLPENEKKVILEDLTNRFMHERFTKLD